MLDLILRLVGPLELVATACPEFDFFEFDPTVAALLTAVNGAVPVYINPSNASDFAYFELEIVCELGVLRMQSGGMGWQFRDAALSPEFVGYRSLDIARQVEGRYLESMARAIDDLYAFLRHGTPISSAGKELIQVQELCSQIQRDALMKCPQHNEN